jgi:hypothetical protein
MTLPGDEVHQLYMTTLSGSSRFYARKDGPLYAILLLTYVASLPSPSLQELGCSGSLSSDHPRPMRRSHM